MEVNLCFKRIFARSSGGFSHFTFIRYGDFQFKVLYSNRQVILKQSLSGDFVPEILLRPPRKTVWGIIGNPDQGRNLVVFRPEIVSCGDLGRILLIPPDFVGKLKDEPKSPKNSLF